jgi:hypothetical protein
MRAFGATFGSKKDRAYPRRTSLGVALASLIAVAACMETAPRPDASRERPIAPPPGVAQNAPSEASQSLAGFYARVQRELLSQGLLRTDGGGPDTPFDADMALRNFERIAFYDEYARGGGLRAAANAPGALRRWEGPVRFAVEFGGTVLPSRQTSDRQMVAGFVQRLARLTGHPLGMAPAAGANFHVLMVGEDDRSQMLNRVKSLVPNIDRASLGLLQAMPRGIHCLVMAFAEGPSDHTYTRAIAVIRAEHPDLLRLSCVHEELAQGLGLANDSPAARPSIFNDDDEFALLTTQDELFLRILYDDRLAPGMTLSQARPIIYDIAATALGGPS